MDARTLDRYLHLTDLERRIAHEKQILLLQANPPNERRNNQPSKPFKRQRPPKRVREANKLRAIMEAAKAPTTTDSANENEAAKATTSTAGVAYAKIAKGTTNSARHNDNQPAPKATAKATGNPAHLNNTSSAAKATVKAIAKFRINMRSWQ
ncbi:unnamed protein product [Sympodiomycopsis kandeliae]